MRSLDTLGYSAPVILLLLLLLNYGDCHLEITSLHIDSPIIAGEGGWLRCDWDEKGNPIYSMKWYWGTHEFYRWTPKLNKPVMVFDLHPHAFTVDRFKSVRGHVYIKEVKLSAARKILRCEVSGEGPIFHTDHREDRLTVVDLPDTRPRITGSQGLYQLNQNVALRCTSPRSKPAASLNFYINGEKANPSWVLHHAPEIEPNPPQLETAILDIRFPLQPRLLHQGKVVVKCAATLKDLYWESNEQVIRGDVPLRASRMEERASSSSSSSDGGDPSSTANAIRDGENFSASTGLLMGAMCLAYLR